MKAIARVAAQHSSEWKPIHAAVMGCLVAHRNRRTEQCSPRRKDIAAHCGVSERTIDRVIAQLEEWGAIRRHQLKALSSREFRPAQYTFLFSLPQADSAQHVEDPGGKTVDQEEPCDKFGGAVRQNEGGPCDKNDTAIRKEAFKILSSKEQSEKGVPSKFSHSKLQPPTPDCPDCHGNGWKMIESGKAAERCECTRLAPEGFGFYVAGRGATVDDLREMGLTEEEAKAQVAHHRELEAAKNELIESHSQPQPSYTQQDFDERDWRKLQKEIDSMREASIGSAEQTQPVAFFRRACERAGISTRRGHELYAKMLA